MTPTSEVPNQLGLLATLLSRPWAISQRHFSALQASFRSVLAHSPESFFELSDFVTSRQSAAITDDGTAIVHVSGALADKAPPIWEKLGHTDYRSVRDEVSSAMDSGASSIHLAIDSPGGAVAGLAETADAISEAARHVPVTAHCDGMACSAGYWLASTADSISASPSAEVGNIGVVLVHYDDSEFLSSLGVEVNVMTNEGADLKGTFRERLTESQSAFLQESLDHTGSEFRQQVEGSRNNIDPEVFRAGWYSGQKAQDLGLIDTLTINK